MITDKSKPSAESIKSLIDKLLAVCQRHNDTPIAPAALEVLGDLYLMIRKQTKKEMATERITAIHEISIRQVKALVEKREQAGKAEGSQCQ